MACMKAVLKEHQARVKLMISALFERASAKACRLIFKHQVYTY